MESAHTDTEPEVCYQEVEVSPEHQDRVDVAFDLLFEEVLSRGFQCPQSPKIEQLTAMYN